MVGWIKMKLDMEVGLGPGRIVLDRDPAPPKKEGAQPSIFGPCPLWPTTGWIKIPLSTDVGLDAGDFVLDGDPVPPLEKGHSPSPIFGPCLLWPNGWMDQDATCYGGRPRPRRHCVRWGFSPPTRKSGTAPHFWPMSILGKRSLISATDEHLLPFWYQPVYQFVLEKRPLNGCLSVLLCRPRKECMEAYVSTRLSATKTLWIRVRSRRVFTQPGVPETVPLSLTWNRCRQAPFCRRLRVLLRRGSACQPSNCCCCLQLSCSSRL